MVLTCAWGERRTWRTEAPEMPGELPVVLSPAPSQTEQGQLPRGWLAPSRALRPRWPWSGGAAPPCSVSSGWSSPRSHSAPFSLLSCAPSDCSVQTMPAALGRSVSTQEPAAGWKGLADQPVTAVAATRCWGESHSMPHQGALVSAASMAAGLSGMANSAFGETVILSEMAKTKRPAPT